MDFTLMTPLEAMDLIWEKIRLINSLTPIPQPLNISPIGRKYSCSSRAKEAMPTPFIPICSRILSTMSRGGRC